MILEDLEITLDDLRKILDDVEKYWTMWKKLINVFERPKVAIVQGRDNRKL